MKTEMKTVLKHSYMGDDVIKYIEQLESALDKACEKLEELEYWYCLFDHDYAESNLYHKGRRCSNKDEWREVLMKDE